MWDQEKKHLQTFEQIIADRRVRPTVLIPLWNVAGFVLGIYMFTFRWDCDINQLFLWSCSNQIKWCIFSPHLNSKVQCSCSPQIYLNIEQVWFDTQQFLLVINIRLLITKFNINAKSVEALSKCTEWNNMWIGPPHTAWCKLYCFKTFALFVVAL